MRIAVTSRIFWMAPQLQQELRDACPNVDIRFNPGDWTYEGDALVEFVRGYDTVLISLERFTHDVLDRLPELRTIVCVSAGLDHVAPALLRERGIRVGWKPGVNKTSVAELTLWMMIGALRRAHEFAIGLKQGTPWPRDRAARSLEGSVVGIHGCGNIGKEVAILARAFGASVIACDRVDFADFYAAHGIESVTQDALWARSDVLSLHLPVNASTRGLYTGEVFDRMKPGAVFINAARGMLVDEAALADRLASGHIAAAAIDAFHGEPTPDRRLIELPNVIATPHIGASCVAGFLAMGRSAIGCVEDNFLPEPGVYPFD